MSSTSRAQRRVALLALAALAASGCAGTSTRQVSGEAPVTSETTASTTSTTRAPDCASTLPTTGQVAQLLMVLVSDPSQAREALGAGQIGGFALKGNQRSDVDEAIADATAESTLPATVAVDEEGGTVQRLRYSAGRLPAAQEMAEGTPQQAAEEVEAHARRMAGLGVTMNFAPVADVGDGAGLGTRSFGDDPSAVGAFAVALGEANADGGVTPVVKHWPGIGGADEDPHDSLAVVAPIEELRQRDLVPFARAFEAGAPAVMVAHAEIPGLTAEGEPASLSRAAITGELRGTEGFSGVVVTDSLGMGAVLERTTQAEAAEAAIAAGADIALLSGTEVIAEAHDRLVDAVTEGRIPADQVEESVRRVLAIRGVEGECFDAVSAYAAQARLESEQQAAEAEAEDRAGTDPGDAESTTTTTSGRDEGINEP